MGGIAATFLALLLSFLLPVSSALAGPPVHTALPALDLVGAAPDPGPVHPAQPFNHACGAAVDSQGDVYVASAGNNAIDVFDSAHKYLASIGGSVKPCGLAVTSKGELYVSESDGSDSDGGNVVRYTPNAYPLVSPPTYGPPEPIDSSGKARGVAVDPVDDHLYVAEGDGIVAYDSGGGQIEAVNEVQRVLTSGGTGGTFRLTFAGETTGPIPYAASHATVQAALEGLSTIGAGNVSVTEGEGTWEGRDHIVTFTGTLAATNVAQVTCDDSGLEGGACNYETKATGFSGRIGNGILTAATGVAAYTYSGDAGHPGIYVFGADAATGEIEVFSGESIFSLTHRQTIDGSDQDAFKADKTADNGIDFGVAGAYLAVDPASGHVLVYDDEHEVVDEFEASGQYVTQVVNPEFTDAEPTAIAVYPEINEIQQVHTNAGGGSFTLSFEGAVTSAISFAANPAAVQAALESLPTIDAGEIFVEEGSAGGLPNRAYNIGFVGGLGLRDEPPLECDASGLTGGTGTCAITSLQQGSGPGRLYVTAGSGSGAKLLAFAPLAAPSRPLRPNLSFALKNASSVAVDSYGNRYVGADTSIAVYPPGSNAPLTTISDPGRPYDLSVDSACNVYALDGNPAAGLEKETAVYFTPSSCPPKPGTKYSGPTIVATGEPPYFKADEPLLGIGIDPSSGHVYVVQRGSQMIELESAKEGSKIADPEWAAGLNISSRQDVDVCGRNGQVYVSGDQGSVVYLVNSAGTEILARITGRGSPRGALDLRTNFAVDQANCHIITFGSGRGAAEEYEPSGAFVGDFGSFSSARLVQSRVAVDSSCAVQKPPLEGAACRGFDPSYGNAYVAFDDPAPDKEFDLTAFGPLSFGEPPLAVAGVASGIGANGATLNGIVTPGGVDLTDCHFEYVSDAAFEATGFTDLTSGGSKPCVPGLAEIGKGGAPVAVHADITGIEPEATRYRFRLVAENKYGGSEPTGLFGPPVLGAVSALPGYNEATLRAQLDPSGLTTRYHFDFVTRAHFEAEGFAHEASTPSVEVPPGDGSVEVEVPVTELAEGTEYRFRIVAENEATTVEGPQPDPGRLVTLERAQPQSCENADYRTGRSVNLPDCRAYELVTPADTRGLTPEAALTITRQFNDRMVAADGERLSFFVNGTLPGFDGNGILDGYRAQRGDGAHPAGGWSSQLFSPTYEDAAVSFEAQSSQEGVASDQGYSFWNVNPLEGILEKGTYLRTPSGFELLGRGSLGTDLAATSDYVASGGAHVIFSSNAHLEEAAAPAPKVAIYDRSAGSPVAQVVSLPSAGASVGTQTEFGTKDATFVGATEDGSAVAFKLGGGLYVRRGGEETIAVAAAPNTFAGISEDGRQVFYASANVFGDSPTPAGLYVCDVSVGDCSGAGKAHEPTEIAPNSRYINVSSDGSHVYFTSTEVLDDELDGTPGANNLYVWDEASGGIRFIAVLDPQDFAVKGFQGLHDNLVRWTDAISPEGRALSTTRSTSTGSVLVFQTHAKLTSYDNTEATAAACGDPEKAGDRCIEVYRYDVGAATGEQLTCLSCDPTDSPPSGDALLQELRTGSTVTSNTLIPNVTDNGGAVFFQSEGPLLPEDANDVQDVYEWQAKGAGGCKRLGGCLALISSGQGDQNSILYAMTSDGHDVFFTTLEKLHGADITGSPSIYDARVNGGVPDPPVPAPCQGDACQGRGTPAPLLLPPTSTGSGNGNFKPGSTRPCPKGKRKVRHNGKVRCVKRQTSKHPSSHRHSKHRGANFNRRVQR